MLVLFYGAVHLYQNSCILFFKRFERIEWNFKRLKKIERGRDEKKMILGYCYV